MNGIGNFDNSISHADVDYLANINASNYLSGLKDLSELIHTKKKLQIIGIISCLIVAILVAMCIAKEGKSAGILIGTIMMSPILLAVGVISLVGASADKRYIKSLIKKIEYDISNRNYDTRKVMFGEKSCETIVEKLNVEGKEQYMGAFIPMEIEDARNKQQRYKFNGDRNYSAPFTYGMILEITYLRKSRVVDRIDIVQ